MEYRSVPGFPRYLVSDTGVVLNNEAGVLLKGKKGRYGHLQVKLRATRGAKPRWFGVHQLVLLAFVGPPPEDHEVRHRDGVSSNNCMSNLTYGTVLENQQDRKIHGTAPVGAANGRAKLDEPKVRAIRVALDRGLNQYDIAAAYGIGQAAVSRIKRGAAWGHAL